MAGDTARLRKLLDQATKRPWIDAAPEQLPGYHFIVTAGLGADGQHQHIASMAKDAAADAALIVEAVNAIGPLLDELDRLSQFIYDQWCANGGDPDDSHTPAAWIAGAGSIKAWLEQVGDDEQAQREDAKAGVAELEAERDRLARLAEVSNHAHLRLIDGLIEALGLDPDDDETCVDGCIEPAGSGHMLWHLVEQRDKARARAEGLDRERRNADRNVTRLTAERDAARARVVELGTEDVRLRDLVAEFRKREESQNSVRDLLTSERDKARAAVDRVRTLVESHHDDECAARSGTPCDCAVADIHAAINGGGE